MNHEQLKKTLRSLPSKGADWIGLKKITSKIKFHSVKNGLPLSNKIYQDEGVQIEVLKNEINILDLVALSNIIISSE